MNTVRELFFLDLREGAAADYERWHLPGAIPSAVIADIRASGVQRMEIFRSRNRLAMSTERMAAICRDRIHSPESTAWESRMEAFQQPLPWAVPGTKWQPAKRIFDLCEHSEEGLTE
ncbi:L-rhamnose mutarotase [Sphingomonas flavalba]|uniref:L-rhamnose mutarotase n=1 Tax=Sphingomonas flavalba TaxID=2559804 RepID=UPI0039E06EEE